MTRRLTSGCGRVRVALAALVVCGGATAAAAAGDRVPVFPSPGWDAGKVVQRGLSVTREGDALVFSQERREAWPQALLPVQPGMAGCSGLAVRAENTGKDLLKIRFAAPGTVMPAERDALMALPSLELKAGESGEITLPLGPLPPLRGEVVRRLTGPEGKAPETEASDRLVVFVYQTGQPRTFRITRIEALGVYGPLPEYCSWEAGRFFPFVDAYGQFKHADWPGKVRSDADFSKMSERERAELAARPAPPGWNAFGGWADGPKRRAPGRFRLEKVDGRWWFVDPEGALWWAHGVAGATLAESPAGETVREAFFESRPAEESGAVDFRVANARKKYGAKGLEVTAENLHRRLRSWGVNVLDADSAPEVTALSKTPYLARLTLTGPRVEGAGDAACPLIDPFDPAFQKEVRRQLEARRGLARDIWCVGLGVDSGIGRLQIHALLGEVMRAPARQPAKVWLLAFLKRRYGTVAKLNAAWKTEYAEWPELLNATRVPTVGTGRDRTEFGELFAETYFSGVASVFKSVFPETLNLGCLLHETDPLLMRLAGWHADAVRVALDDGAIPAFEVSPYLERPVLVVAEPRKTPGGVCIRPLGLEDAGQAAWAAAYAARVGAALRHPNVAGIIGCRYAEGNAAGAEGYDGLVSVADTPHAARVAAVRAAGATLYGMRQAHVLRAQVAVDASKSMGPRREIERYINNSILMRSPPLELAKVIEREYGRARVVRCWVCLDDLWDIKTGAYNLNYPIKNRVKGEGADFEMPDVPFESYLTAYGGIADEVLLNVRRLERHVVEGRMTMAQWKEVCKTALRRYKTICPNLRYIEALNEFHAGDFGNLNTDAYYGFYRAMYQAVNELNAEMKPALPLLVGGPATTGTPPDRHLREFVALYAADPAPDKRLDFLSYHYYGNQKWSEAAGFEKRMTDLLDSHRIASDIPMFWDEMGFTGSPWKVLPVARDLNRLQATCVTAFQYFSRKNRKLHVLPWVTFHSPSQTALTQFFYAPDGTLRMAPFGMAVKCWGMQKRSEVQTESTGLREDGGGLGAMGAADEGGVSVLFWNHQLMPCEVELRVAGLEAKLAAGWQARRYLSDSRHSNAYADLSKPAHLESVEEADGRGAEVTRRFLLEPYAVSLLLVEPISK